MNILVGVRCWVGEVQLAGREDRSGTDVMVTLVETQMLETKSEKKHKRRQRKRKTMQVESTLS